MDSSPLVFVVGDFLIDMTFEGTATHIAPDAPIPVLEIHNQHARAGGMWNAAVNVRAAGAKIRCFGVGPETLSPVVQDVLAETFEPGESTLIAEAGRVEQVKTRFLGQYGRQMLRADTMKDGPISKTTAEALLVQMQLEASTLGREPDIIFVADYGCGVITQGLMASLLNAFPISRIVVDPYPTTNPRIYAGCFMLTPNAREAQAIAEELKEKEPAALTQLCAIVVIKQGGDPVIVIPKESEPFEVFPPKRLLVDACGAGDSFTAHLCAELARGIPLRDCIEVAAHAGAVAVTQVGVQVVTREQVRESMGSTAIPA